MYYTPSNAVQHGYRWAAAEGLYRLVDAASARLESCCPSAGLMKDSTVFLADARLYRAVVVVMTADDLLAGPRGRHLCMAVAHRLNQDVRSAWWQASKNMDRAAIIAELVRVIGCVDVTPVCQWVDPLTFLEPVGNAVAAAMYWQPPHDKDVVAAHPDVAESLRSLATAVTASPASAWWTTPLDLSALRYTCLFEGQGHPAPPVLSGTTEELNRWRTDTLADERDAVRNRPSDPAAPHSGHWWSTPALASLATTTRPLPRLGSIEMAWQEDSVGQSNAAVWTLKTTQAPQVWEIDGPKAWTDLVKRYPMDVTSSRRHDWYRTTGYVGTWRIPDWSAVAADWDAVHLTVAGYLTTATRALPLNGAGAATMLGGWNPDQTWWLSDILETETPEPESWHNLDPHGPNFAWRLEQDQ